MSSHTRLNYRATSPDAFRAMIELNTAAEGALGKQLLELVRLRASQLNGCAYCIDMHTKDARAEGETEQRLYLTSAWREAGCYSQRERTALEWTEAVTLLSPTGVSEELYDRARGIFSEKDLCDLTFAIVAINGWNRLSVSFQPPVGNYRPGEH